MEGEAGTSSLQEIPVGRCLELFGERVIYEAIVGSPHGSLHPLGLRRIRSLMHAKIYHPSYLLKHLSIGGSITASFPDNALVYYRVLRGVQEKCRGPAGLPTPCGSPLIMLLRLVELDRRGLSSQASFKINACYYSPRLIMKPYTRADALLLEELVHYTRIKPYMDQGLGHRVFDLLRLIERHASAISRIAPGTEYEEAARSILEESRRLVSPLL